jgi:hypothetical protein
MKHNAMVPAWLVMMWGAVLLASCAGAQTSMPQDAASKLTVPVVSFALDFPGSMPERYRFDVGSDGHSTYDSVSKISSESEDRDDFHHEFVMSAETRGKVFTLAGKASHFQKLKDQSTKTMAVTGMKTLAYRDAGGTTQATYNYSQQAPVQELTTLFQNLSLTLEFGRRLKYDLRYQKLALDHELKRMEEMAHANSLVEISAVGEILNQVANDPGVLNVVRGRALRLMAMRGEAK